MGLEGSVEQLVDVQEELGELISKLRGIEGGCRATPVGDAVQRAIQFVSKAWGRLDTACAAAKRTYAATMEVEIDGHDEEVTVFGVPAPDEEGGAEIVSAYFGEEEICLSETESDLAREKLVSVISAEAVQ